MLLLLLLLSLLLASLMTHRQVIGAWVLRAHVPRSWSAGLIGMIPRCLRSVWTRSLRLQVVSTHLDRPAKLHADKSYDYKPCRPHLRRRGIASRIGRRGVESSERLGLHR